MAAQVIVLHGFDNDQAIAVMRAAKKAAAEAGMDPASIAFATTTPTNVTWKVSKLLEEVAEEHEYMKQNPPGRAPGGTRMA